MMEIIKLSATRRQESGKGPSNRLRRTGNIPAICYGKGLEAFPVAVSPKALLEVLKSAHGKNSVIELAVEGSDNLTVMVRDYGYHPISRELVHADFLQVKLDQPVDVEVPVRCVGKSKGVAGGGILQQIFRNLPIRCLPEKIPALVEIDISELDLGDTVKAGAVALPEGVKTRLPDDQTVVVVAVPEKGEEAAAAPGAPGAPAAAPAAGAKGAAPAAKAAAAPAAKGAAPAAKAAAPAKDAKKK
ncbi:50S ribosomal protein L25/general stress protein Ctc [Polyangium sp. 6x1]|uniref:50S ribosomal protein L25/general stress protein Ctc n=1 Tax=Polyangium sp. 6x1 TaxID=3042689 RepID=UPI002482FE9C|nr:50S ribosomal protein L25/general stress protein Ctc [Polyangium sp. 6x1]MDI1446551.1 50S ribosomal protein L25/general stress protein Ctc [Polyangium sp. 6x1]